MKNKKIFVSAVSVVLLIIVLLMVIVSKNNKANADIEVPDYYSLSEFNFNGNFKTFRKDCYDWYKSIENEEGVYLINTAFYDEDLLEAWKKNKIYNAVPDHSFWYFTASPSYLTQMGVEINEEEISAAQNGTRLYLIPDTLSESESEKMCSFLKEDALEKADTSDIKTAFTMNQKVKIIKYTPNREYFTWPGDREQAIVDKAPVIYVCTSENMKYFENESLISTGVDSYVKFADEKAIRKYAENSVMKKYNSKFAASSDIYVNAAKSKLVDRGIEKVFESFIYHQITFCMSINCAN